MLGVYASAHPLQRLIANVDSVVTETCDEITIDKAGKNVVLAGMIAAVRIFFTKNGNRMAFVTLEDLQGNCDVTVFPRTLEATPPELMQEGAIVLVRGKVDVRNERVNVIADNISDNFAYAQPVNGGSGVSATSYAVPNGYQGPQVSDLHEDPWGYDEDGVGESQEYPWRWIRGRIRLHTPPLPWPLANVSNGSNAHTNQMDLTTQAPPEPRTVHVHLTRSAHLDADKARLRQAVDVLRRYAGPDRFKVILNNKDGLPGWEIDFPNDTTRYCGELAGELRDLLGSDCLQVISA